MTIQDMIEKLNHQEITSVELVKHVLKQHEQCIDKNAIASINPRALELAMEKDDERRKGRAKGILHGIPIAIKDNILYQDGTVTTCNSYAFHDFYPPFSASITKMLEDEGAIIVAKTNLSEFAYFMSDEQMPSGYGSMHGQVKHPFDETIDPYGSSTGSAVAVKLDIVAGAIGTETNGSLMAPAYQCQIVSYKPTFGLLSTYGIIPISPVQDTAGPMAHTVYDCALIMDAMNKKDVHDKNTLKIKRESNIHLNLDDKLNQKRVGLFRLSNHPYDQASELVLENAKRKLIQMGHDVIELAFDYAHISNNDTLLTEFKSSINHFLSEVRMSTPHKTLSDIISFNELNRNRCLVYGQSLLIQANETDGNLFSEAYKHNRDVALKKAAMLENLMVEHNLVAVAAPMWLGYAPIYGNPSACIPEGIYDGKPKAMVFVGKKHDDAMLLKLTHQYQIFQ